MQRPSTTASVSLPEGHPGRGAVSATSARRRTALRLRALLPLFGLICFAWLLAAPRARAFLYWTSGATALNRVGNDGSGLGSFIQTPPLSYAVAINSSYIYWTANDGRIGRANIDGSNPNPDFITGLSQPSDLVGLAVDGSHIYWSSETHIGRANLDGSGVEPTFLPANHAIGMAVDGTHIYWGENITDHIARARLDGSGYEPEWIPAPGNPCSLAVDSGHVYWADSYGKIGRTNLTGTAVEPSFIDPGTPVDCGVAVDSSYIYFSISSKLVNGKLVAPSTIARANLDGSGLNTSLFSLAPYGGPEFQLAVDSLSAPPAPPSNSFKIVGLFRSKRKGFAKVKVELPGPGKVVVFGKRVRKAVRSVGEARTVALRIRPKRRLAKRLRRKRRVAIFYKVRFKPTGGTPRTKRKQVLLVRRR